MTAGRIAGLVVGAGLAACVLAPCALAQEMGEGPRPRGGPGGMMSPEQRQQMMKQRMEEMQARDAELEKLVATMNQASGAAKVDAIAAVVNELVAQHRMRHAQRGQMRKMRGGHRMGGGDDGAEQP